MTRSLYFILLSFLLCSSLPAQWIEETTPVGFTPRNHPVTFSIGDIGYVLTGFNGNSGSDLLDDMWSFDPSSSTWTSMDDFPGGNRGFAYGLSYDGIGYAGFGLNTDFFTFQEYLNDLWAFDPESNTWTELAPCPCSGRRHPALVAADGVIYVGMGDNGNADLNDWWAYDIESNTWSEKASLPAAGRHHPYYFTADDVPYVGFGHSGQIIFDDFYRYNADSDTWTALEDFPGEGRVAGTQFAYNGKGYILSGQGTDHLNLDDGEFYRYNHEDDTWTELPAHPGEGRWAPGTFVIGSTLYFIAGRINNDESDMLSFDLDFNLSLYEQETSRISVYPNPAENILHYTTENMASQSVEIEIVDIRGSILHSSALSSVEGTIDISELPQGLYILTVKGANQVSQEKFQKL